ncbi:hypothetical protein [Paenibacillus sp. Soil787]|uniref:hypothetical protein n=1 Tax=Paenibacillus sp. Soil787 TaxID=1736411 RepID=UPI000702796B|nr:hypothetical protein ASG93_13105 [Paenibacillus sp. Soil787]
MGIGTELMKRANQILSQNEAVERSRGLCIDDDRSSLQFLYKNGYYISYSSYIMERVDERLPESNIAVRQYEDDDYLICQSISEFGIFDGGELSHVSVRHDLQSRGYGRAFVSFLVNEIMRRCEKNVNPTPD